MKVIIYGLLLIMLMQTYFQVKEKNKKKYFKNKLRRNQLKQQRHIFEIQEQNKKNIIREGINKVKEDQNRKLSKMQSRMMMFKQDIEEVNKDIERLKKTVEKDLEVKVISSLEKGTAMCENFNNMFEDSNQLKQMAEGWIKEKTGKEINLLGDMNVENAINLVSQMGGEKVAKIMKQIQSVIGQVDGLFQLLDFQKLISDANSEVEKLKLQKKLDEFLVQFQSHIVDFAASTQLYKDFMEKKNQLENLQTKIVDSIQGIDQNLKQQFMTAYQAIKTGKDSYEKIKQQVESQVNDVFNNNIMSMISLGQKQYQELIEQGKANQDLVVAQIYKYLNSEIMEELKELNKNLQLAMKDKQEDIIKLAQKKLDDFKNSLLVKISLNAAFDKLKVVQEQIDEHTQQVQQYFKQITETYKDKIQFLDLDMFMDLQKDINVNDLVKTILKKKLEQFQKYFTDKVTEIISANVEQFNDFMDKKKHLQFIEEQIVKSIKNLDAGLKKNYDEAVKSVIAAKSNLDAYKEHVQNVINGFFDTNIIKRLEQGEQQIMEVVEQAKVNSDLIIQKVAAHITLDQIIQIKLNYNLLQKAIKDKQEITIKEAQTKYDEFKNGLITKIVINISFDQVKKLEEFIQTKSQIVQDTFQAIADKYAKEVNLEQFINAKNILIESHKHFMEFKKQIEDNLQILITGDLSKLANMGEEMLKNKLDDLQQQGQQYIAKIGENIMGKLGPEFSQKLDTLQKNPMGFLKEQLNVDKHLDDLKEKGKNFLDNAAKLIGLENMNAVKEKCVNWVKDKVEMAQKGFSVLKKGVQAVANAAKTVGKILANPLIKAALVFTGPIGLGLSMGMEMFSAAAQFASEALEMYEEMKEKLFNFLNEAQEQLESYKVQLEGQIQTLFVDKIEGLFNQANDQIIAQIQSFKNDANEALSKLPNYIDNAKVELLKQYKAGVDSAQELITKTVKSKRRFKFQMKNQAKKIKELNDNLEKAQQQYDQQKKQIVDALKQEVGKEKISQLEQGVEKAQKQIDENEAEFQRNQLYSKQDKSDQATIRNEMNKKLDNLESKISEMFSQLELKQELNAAKQNMFKSVEILLYAEEQIQNVEQNCGGNQQQNNNNAIAQVGEAKVDNFQCLLAQRQYLDNMKFLSFDFNFKQILRMYAGQVSLFGVDYFAKIYEISNGDQEQLKTQYGFVQGLIKRVTVAYQVFNQLNSKFSADQIIIQQQTLKFFQNKKNSDEEVANMDQVLQVSTCLNCQQLDKDNSLLVAIGDAIYCRRCPSAECDQQEKENKEKTDPESADQNLKVQKIIADKNVKTYDIKLPIFAEQKILFDTKSVITDLEIKKFISNIRKKLPQIFLQKMYIYLISHTQSTNNDLYTYKSKSAEDFKYYDPNKATSNFYIKNQPNDQSPEARFVIIQFNRDNKNQQMVDQNTEVIKRAFIKYFEFYNKEKSSFITKHESCSYVEQEIIPILDKLSNYQFICNFKYKDTTTTQFNFQPLDENKYQQYNLGQFIAYNEKEKDQKQLLYSFKFNILTDKNNYQVIAKTEKGEYNINIFTS